MIISEKQIMYLINIAHDAKNLVLEKGDNWHKWAEEVSRLIDNINNQQSEELKVIE